MIENSLNFKIFKEIDRDLEFIWKDFERKNFSHVFQSLTFIKEYLLQEKNNFFFVTIYYENELITILPLEIKKIFGFKILQWIGTKEFDYCCPIISDYKKYKIDKENFISIWNLILKKIEDFDVIILDKQPKKIFQVENPFVSFLNNFLTSKIYLIDLPKSELDYFKNFNDKKFLNEFQRTTKKLLNDNKINFSILNDENHDLSVINLIQNKANFLNTKKIKNHLDKKFISYFSKLYKTQSRILQLSMLKINNQLVAANLGLLYKNSFYYYLPTIFTNSFNKYSPGKLLISRLIEWCIKNNVKYFDFGLGDENYKKYWSNDQINLFRHFEFKGLKGLIFISMIKFYLFFKKL